MIKSTVKTKYQKKYLKREKKALQSELRTLKTRQVKAVRESVKYKEEYMGSTSFS